jgi:hypothetical protein
MIGINPYSLHHYADVVVVLYKLMMEIDKHIDFDRHPIRNSEPFKNAIHALGWDIDWDKSA